MTVPHEIDESTLTYSYVSYVLDKGEWTKLASPDKTRQSVYGRSINASGVVVASIDSIDEDTQALSAIWEDGEGRILNEGGMLPAGQNWRASSNQRLRPHSCSSHGADKVPHAIILRPAETKHCSGPGHSALQGSRGRVERTGHRQMTAWPGSSGPGNPADLRSTTPMTRSNLSLIRDCQTDCQSGERVAGSPVSNGTSAWLARPVPRVWSCSYGNERRESDPQDGWHGVGSSGRAAAPD